MIAFWANVPGYRTAPMSRVLVIGWDGATWSVAGPMCAEGRLPTLEGLRSQGAAGILETVPNMNSAPAWSTIATGLNPGRHGIFYFDEPVPGTYRRTVVNAGRRTGASLWSRVSEAGKRVVVVNVPISYPAAPVNGFLVAGLDAPSKTVPGFTHPADLSERHADLFRDYVIEPGAPSLIRAGRVREAQDRLLSCVDGWAAVTERLMREQDWDLVFVVFTSTDTSQHFFWRGEDRRLVERVYEVQDEATARLVEGARTADPDVNVIVLADHGGADNTRGPEFMPIWLEDQGLQVRRKPSLKSRALSSGFGLVNRTLSRERKQAMARRFPRLREQAQAEARLFGIDWSRTRAYSDGLRDEVLLNVAGRDPSGQVSAERYDPVVEDMKQAMAGIRELGSGRPAVASVVHRAEAYWGPYVDRAPDLTIRWNLDGPFQGFACTSAAATARMRAAAARPPFQTGGHHPEGILAASGPGIQPGPVAGGLQDVTPTILALLGLPVPADLDGKPMACVRTSWAEAEPGTPAALELASDGAEPDPLSGYTPEEEEAVRRRLEDLGYL
jgi:predicted AlkP superfamily phosphohydrolase/phosphomutase